MLENKNILLVITGGIAAYKSLELIRLLRKDGAQVRCILSKGGAQFITPLSVASLSEQEVYTDLFSLKDETEMGHIRLSREADLIIVAPASANMIAKMTHGIADDLATTTLLAANKPILFAPAMNQMMWQNEATQDNVKTLQSRGLQMIGPAAGEMACGETGMGRMIEPQDIMSAATEFLTRGKPLAGRKALVTSGPTFEPIDPVRFIGNRSSGKQGHAIAAALRDAGADVTLITGPVNIADPSGVKTVHIHTATEMLDACRNALPTDIAVCAAAVSDWSAAAVMRDKIKKRGDNTPPDIKLKENPDILEAISSKLPHRPALVIGFAAETEKLLEHAQEKLTKKKCDWIIANDVGKNGALFGADENHVHLLDGQNTTEFPKGTKKEIAEMLVSHMIDFFKKQTNDNTQKAAE